MILQRKDAEPSTCGCCGRQAAAIGYANPPRAKIMWLCLKCPPIAGAIYEMKNPSVYEDRACFEAGKMIAGQAAQAILAALWEGGITDLSALDEAAMDAALERLALGGEMKEVARLAVSSFGDSIRNQVKNNDAPF